MKKQTTILALIFVCFGAAVSAGCGWNPAVTAVPVTAPWDSMNLPIKQDAIVYESSPTELKVLHKDDRAKVAPAYDAAILAAGWKSAGKKAGDEMTNVFQKDGKTLEAYVYPYENTGVILTLK